MLFASLFYRSFKAFCETIFQESYLVGNEYRDSKRIESFAARRRFRRPTICQSATALGNFILSKVLYVVEPKIRVREIAETLPQIYGLRALDSFQLAAALVWCKEKPRNRPFVCYDDKLAKAAEKAGFTVFK